MVGFDSNLVCPDLVGHEIAVVAIQILIIDSDIKLAVRNIIKRPILDRNYTFFVNCEVEVTLTTSLTDELDRLHMGQFNGLPIVNHFYAVLFTLAFLLL